ncbi:HAMP domain-containing protein [bacterium]|nr:HAMP domain-containing protein [candidate division CSSED10-310 bacterium]
MNPTHRSSTVDQPAGTPVSKHKSISRRRRRNLILGACALVIMLPLIFAQYSLVEETAPIVLAILNVNIIILLFLIFMILRNLIKLYVEHSQKQAGSRFRNKLVLAFTTLTFVPSLLLVFAGSNLITSSIKSWFDPQVQHFLDDVIDVARVSLDMYKSICIETSHDIISSLRVDSSGVYLKESKLESSSIAETILERFPVDIALIVDRDAQEISRASSPDIPSEAHLNVSGQFINRVLNGESSSMVSSLGSGDIMYYGFALYEEKSITVEAAVIIGMRIRGDLSERISNIRSNYEKYLQQKQSIRPSQGLYLSIFIMISLTVLFAALWISFYFARQISFPISHLSHATLEVAKGNYDYHLDIPALDELGDLVRSFNSMTDELRNNRNVIEKTTFALHQRNREIETRRNELEVILSTIKSGVIALDVDGYIRVINSAACGFLNLSSREIIHKTYSAALHQSYLKPFVDILERMYVDRYKVFQNEIQLETGSRLSTFSINVTPLYGGKEDFNGVVVVMNDLTQLLRIQRIVAWREVAKRLAHEIKNPLTPIQLNTQRMQKKFREQAADFPTVFETSTESIIEEVSGLRSMLNEFSQLAQMPEAILTPGDIHETISQVVALYAGRQEIEMEMVFADDVPQIMFDKAQIKRVFINLIDNAIHAMNGLGKVVIKTSYDRIIEKVRIEVIDTGAGVPSQEKNKLFMPYFSTKRDGSGLGLTICSRIITDHDGSIRVTDNEPKGARFIIELPVLSSCGSLSPGSGVA